MTWNSTFKNPGQPLKRKTPLIARKKEHKSALKSGEKKLRQRVILDEQPVFRSEAYLAAVRTLDCVCCGKWRAYTQAAHSNQLMFSKAKGQKASDATAMALCGTIPGFAIGCHALLDQGGKLTKEQRNQFEYEHIHRTIFALIRAGKLEGADEAMQMVNADYDSYESAVLVLVPLIEGGNLKVVGESRR